MNDIDVINEKLDLLFKLLDFPPQEHDIVCKGYNIRESKSKGYLSDWCRCGADRVNELIGKKRAPILTPEEVQECLKK